MKKLLLASVLAIASVPGYAADTNDGLAPDNFAPAECNKFDGSEYEACVNRVWNEKHQPPARVTVAPPYQGPPPIGWVYGPYTQCANPPQCSMAW
jgi:hypothetical protein